MGSGSLGPGGRSGIECRVSLQRQMPGMMLHLPEACRVFSHGSCSWITGPWQWWAAQAPGREVVDSDLWLHTGFLAATTAALAFHAHLGSTLIATARTRLWSSFRRCSESPLLEHPETMVSRLLGRSRLFPGLPPG